MKKIYKKLILILLGCPCVVLMSACGSVAMYTPEGAPSARIRLSSEQAILFEIQDEATCPQYKLIAKYDLRNNVLWDSPGPKIGMPEVDGKVNPKSGEFYLPAGKEVRIIATYSRREGGYDHFCSLEGGFKPEASGEYDLGYFLTNGKCSLRLFRLKTLADGKIGRVPEPLSAKAWGSCRQPRTYGL